MLRTLIIALSTVGLVGSALAQEGALPHEYAPGSQGDIEPSIGAMVKDAKELGQTWAERLTIQEPNDFNTNVDFDALRTRALNNPRVRALLGADDGVAQGGAHEDRYGDDQVFVLASFSMPVESLRALMVEAKALEVPIIMRGFVGNSVFETQAAIQQVFGDDADAIGFGIDPTMFTRFGVENVPQLIVTNAPLEVCELSGCEGETPPVFDVVKGNIPIRAGLELIAFGGGETSETAKATLARGH